MTLRTRRLVCMCVLAATLAAACTDMDSSTSDPPALGEPAAAEQDATSREWLFSVQADGPSSYADGTLVMPASSVVAFTDRPHRDSRITSLEWFAALWDLDGPDSFEDDPPNGVLTYWDGAGLDARPHSVVCEIVPDVSTVTGASGRAISMGLKLLEPEGVQLPATLHRAALFIDDFPATCATSDEDEQIVEFANLEEFDELITITSEGAGGGTELAVDCGESQYVPEQFQLVLGDVDDPANQTVCGASSPWKLSASQLASSAMCVGGRCTMPVTVRNAESLVVFSSTMVELEPSTAGAVTMIPELNPATLPICPLAQAPETGPSSAFGTLQLCESPVSCNGGR